MDLNNLQTLENATVSSLELGIPTPNVTHPHISVIFHEPIGQ